MAENSNELTSTLRLTPRELSSSGALSEYVATLPDADREVIAAIQAAGGDKAMVLINRGENKGSRFLITHEGVSIGRATSSGVFLDDVTVSRKHAVIEKSANGFVLRDCGSLNGTYVNNSSVAQVSLTNGDEIQIGKFHLLFVSGIAQGKI